MIEVKNQNRHVQAVSNSLHKHRSWRVQLLLFTPFVILFFLPVFNFIAENRSAYNFRLLLMLLYGILFLSYFQDFRNGNYCQLMILNANSKLSKGGF